MFRFRNFTCKFVTSRDMYGNICTSVYTDEGMHLYRLTEELSFRIPDGMIAFKDAPYVLQFLAQMQKEGLLRGSLERKILNGKQYLLGKSVSVEILQKHAAAGER